MQTLNCTANESVPRHCNIHDTMESGSNIQASLDW